MKSFSIITTRTDDPGKTEELHSLRIAAKNLRYTLENFRDFYGGELDEFIDAAQSLQATLGRYGDLSAWTEGIPALAKEAKGRTANKLVGKIIDDCSIWLKEAYDSFKEKWDDTIKEKTWKKVKDRFRTGNR